MNKLKNICIFLFSDIFEKFFACWFFAGAGIMLFSKGNIQLDNTDISKSILLFTLSFALLSLAEQMQKGFRYLALPVSVLFFGLILLYYNSSIYTFFAIAVIYALCDAVWNTFWASNWGKSSIFSNTFTFTLQR